MMLEGAFTSFQFILFYYYHNFIGNRTDYAYVYLTSRSSIARAAGA